MHISRALPLETQLVHLVQVATSRGFELQELFPQLTGTEMALLTVSKLPPGTAMKNRYCPFSCTGQRYAPELSGTLTPITVNRGHPLLCFLWKLQIAGLG